jgi:tetratricopeptide (TPR) repeat protein
MPAEGLPADGLLAGQRVALVGKLAGMSRREAEQLLRDHGATIAPQIDANAELVVLGDEAQSGSELRELQATFDDATRAAWQEGRLQVVRESELWARLGLVDGGQEVQRLYTPVMLAELVRVPVRAVRHWHRKGHLTAERRVGRLAYFNFEQARAAQRLAELLAAGCSLAQIDRKLDELTRVRPETVQPLADAAVVVVGRRLYVRRGEQLSEPSGQLLIDFDAPQVADTDDAGDESVATIPISAGGHTELGAVPDFGTDDLRSLADEFDENCEPERAIEVYRSILMSGDFNAEDHFSLAELLYRSGEFAAARERYYAAIELDEHYVEARANLGCLLAEQGEYALAEAAFRGALEYHPSFADAHFHLARLLDATNKSQEATWHWQRFLDLAPASPWAEEALDRTNVDRRAADGAAAQPSH